MTKIFIWVAITSGMMLCNVRIASAQEPPPINPFGSKTTQREDAVPGYLELSDGSIRPGQIYLTRDKRLIIADEQLQRQREIPLSAVKQINCTIKKQWMEKEWKFKETTKDEKMYTGRSYPVREYEHTITLHDGRTVSGGLSAIVYVQPADNNPAKSDASRSETKVEQYILNKRNKGEIGKDFQALVYVKSIKLGKEAFEEGKQKAAEYGKKIKKK
ncbi:MAG: hypothetical protein ABSA26_16630 [Thermoguttaceae bacterium]|jgi:hypothetical protein